MSFHVPRPIEQVDFQLPPRNSVEAVLMAAPRLISEAREYAVAVDGSYRGFNVGAALLVREVESGQYLSVLGANYKQSETAWKVCAEQDAISYLRERAMSPVTIIGAYVTAPVQPDKHSALEFPTLHPCGDCRASEEVLKSPLVSTDAVVVTAQSSADVLQVFSPAELDKIHEGVTQLGERAFIDPGFDHLRTRAFFKLDLLRMGMEQPEEFSDPHEASAAALVRYAMSD